MKEITMVRPILALARLKNMLRKWLKGCLIKLTASKKKKKLSIKEYCSNVCKAKCCYTYYNDEPIAPCPKLNNKNLCSIYKERFTENKPFDWVKAMPYKGNLLVINASCGNIKDIIKNNQLNEKVKKQCCYYNPKLLVIHDEN